MERSDTITLVILGIFNDRAPLELFRSVFEDKSYQGSSISMARVSFAGFSAPIILMIRFISFVISSMR